MHRRLVALIAVLTLLLNALPVFAQPQRGVDIVIILDTSGPMLDGFDKFCVTFPQDIAALQQHGFDLQVTVLGITKPYACARTTVRSISGSTVASDNDWGAAIADVAAKQPWRPNALRLIIPLSNRGPALGDPVEDPGADRDAIQAAIRAAQANRVVVLPVLGAPDRSTQPEDRSTLQQLAHDLAQATGGVTTLLQSNAGDPTSDILSAIGAVTQSGSESTTMLPIPGSIYTLTCRRDVSKCVSFDPGVLVTNAVVTVLIVAIAGMSTALFSASRARLQLPAVKLDDRVKSAVSAGAQHAQRGIRSMLAPGTWTIGTPLLRWTLATTLILVFDGLAALLMSFIDPPITVLSGRGLAIFTTLFLAVGLTTWLAAWSQTRALRRGGLAAALQVRPLMLLLTFIAVLVSRAINFLPGFLVALFVAESIFNATGDVAGPRRRAALRGLLAVVFVVVVTYLLAVPIDVLLGDLQAQTNNPAAQTAAAALDLVESLVLTMYIVALEYAFFALFPSRFTLGSRVFDFNRLVWGVSLAVLTFLLLTTAINPTLSGVEVFRLPAIIVIGGILLMVSAVALGAWLRANNRQMAGDQRLDTRSMFSATTLLVMWVFVCGCSAVYLITRIGK